MVALDFDPRNGAEETFRRLVHADVDLPLTLTTSTPSGGWHYLYQLPDDTGANWNPMARGLIDHSGLPGVDILCGRSLLVVPPSLREFKDDEGVFWTDYRFHTDQGNAPVVAPEWLLTVLKEASS